MQQAEKDSNGEAMPPLRWLVDDDSPEVTLSRCEEVLRFVGNALPELTRMGYASSDAQASFIILNSVADALQWEATRLNENREKDLSLTSKKLTA